MPAGVAVVAALVHEVSGPLSAWYHHAPVWPTIVIVAVVAATLEKPMATPVVVNFGAVASTVEQSRLL